eukprot:360737-Chlamydomonas_euryale.AAC.9
MQWTDDMSAKNAGTATAARPYVNIPSHLTRGMSRCASGSWPCRLDEAAIYVQLSYGMQSVAWVSVTTTARGSCLW